MLGFHEHLVKIKGLVEAELDKAPNARNWKEIQGLIEDHWKLDSKIKDDVRVASRRLEDYEIFLRALDKQVHNLVNYISPEMGVAVDNMKRSINSAVKNAKEFEDRVEKIRKEGKGLL